MKNKRKRSLISKPTKIGTKLELNFLTSLYLYFKEIIFKMIH